MHNNLQLEVTVAFKNNSQEPQFFFAVYHQDEFLIFEMNPRHLQDWKTSDQSVTEWDTFILNHFYYL